MCRVGAFPIPQGKKKKKKRTEKNLLDFPVEATQPSACPTVHFPHRPLGQSSSAVPLQPGYFAATSRVPRYHRLPLFATLPACVLNRLTFQKRAMHPSRSATDFAWRPASRATLLRLSPATT